MKPAVFLDRDGTLIEERGYLDRMELLSIFPWTADALRLLKRAGYTLVVVTNQSALARGIIDEAFLDAVHREINDRLARGGVTIDGFYHCPHLADAPVEKYRDACRCRKPGPGMIERAVRERGLDPARSFMIGDRWIDVACGAAAGVRTIRVLTGHRDDDTQHGADVSRRSSEHDPAVAEDLSRRIREGERIAAEDLSRRSREGERSAADDLSRRSREGESSAAEADAILNNLMEAAGWILRNSQR